MTLKVVRGVSANPSPETKPLSNQATTNSQTTAGAIRAASVVATTGAGVPGSDAAVNQIRTVQRTQNTEKIRKLNLEEAEAVASDLADEVRGNKEQAVEAHYNLSSSSGSGTLA